ncbi:MAG: endonuclease MutS2 [Acetivibrionales bacterium]|jgi:DNA mismatch repair protein MutS2|nr:endonuclease MutS2 [Clostridiaceae bacterium]
MNDRALRVLEYNKIIKMLRDRTVSSLGRSYVEKLKPDSDFFEVEASLKETTHALAYLWRKGGAPFGGIHDVRAAVKRVDIGSVLSISELLRIGDVLRCSRNIKQFLTNDIPSEWQDNTALELGRQINVLRSLEEEISNAIISEEEISDRASPELSSVRRSIRQKQEGIKDRLFSIIRSSEYRKILQDAVVTLRGDRYVIPVKQEYKAQVPGLVHDMSSSGATVFVEPLSIVEANNEIKALFIREQQEIERILEELTTKVAQVKTEIEVNLEILAHLDFMFAKAKLSRDMNAICPHLTDKRQIRIKQGRHPLLDKHSVVPIDIELGHSFSTLVITGPNTGGKTVTLKTVGLFVLMLQSGLHVPVKEGSEFGIFKNVYADIGDEQSIEQSLSTFSSHMKNIVNILKWADEDSLVIFDELGAGTDPTEGAALAIAILDGLTKRGIRTMATTHYSELKIYALSAENVENACCEFDVETLRPTYKLLVGVPGKSNAFAISQKLGLDSYIIDKAKGYLSKDNLQFEDVLSDIEKNRTQAEKEKESIEQLRREIEALKAEARKEKERIEKEKSNIIAKAREEARTLVKSARYESEDLLEKIKDVYKQGMTQHNGRNLNEARAGLRQLENLEGSFVESYDKHVYAEAPKDLKAGESVMMINLGQKATVLEPPDADGQVLVQAGIMKVKVNAKQLKRVDEQKESLDKMQRVRVSGVKASPVKLELDLRGLNVEEALERVDKYIDDAVIAGLHEVTIIHGKGTGTLRKAIHRHFRGHTHVESYRLGVYGEGEDGVTVVELK